jgi:hypothetical protein
VSLSTPSVKSAESVPPVAALASLRSWQRNHPRADQKAQKHRPGADDNRPPAAETEDRAIVGSLIPPNRHELGQAGRADLVALFEQARRSQRQRGLGGSSAWRCL